MEPRLFSFVLVRRMIPTGGIVNCDQLRQNSPYRLCGSSAILPSPQKFVFDEATMKVVAAIICLVTWTTACQAKSSPMAAESYQVRVWALRGTGQSFARLCAPSASGIILTVVAAPNGPMILKSLDDGSADVAFVTASLLYEGYQGGIPEFPDRFQKISGLAVLQPQVEHVLVGPRSTIASLEDLAGRVVAIGRPGTRNAITAPKLLEQADLVRPARLVHTDFDSAIAKLLDGTVDAVMLPGLVPLPAATRAMSSGARIVEIRGSLADHLRERVRFMHPYTIPPDTYPGQHKRVVTLGMDSVFVARRNLPDWVARRVVGALFDCLPRLAAVDPSFQTVDINRAAATPLPLHPGAALYYREKEIAP
jgi:TRAP transporter TAXI family solute receptor